MNRFLCLMGVIIGFSLSVSAQTTTCAKGAGTVIKGNDGTEYCLSKMKMNWWTALGWCQSIGKALIQYPSDCRCDGDNCPTEMVGCPNLKGVGDGCVWTSTPFGGSDVYNINLATGARTTFWFDTQRNQINDYALCK